MTRPSSTARGLGADHRRLRLVVLERDGYRCHWCGAPADTSDHLLERALGGSNTLANLVAACSSCNTRRGGALGARRRRANRPGPHPFFVAGGAEDPVTVNSLSPNPESTPGVVTRHG